MANSSATTAEARRISAGDLKARLDRGESATIIDVRNPKAWASSNVKIKGAIRSEADRVRPDPRWPKDRLTVVY
jgi:hypothetical protein